MTEIRLHRGSIGDMTAEEKIRLGCVEVAARLHSDAPHRVETLATSLATFVLTGAAAVMTAGSSGITQQRGAWQRGAPLPPTLRKYRSVKEVEAAEICGLRYLSGSDDPLLVSELQIDTVTFGPPIWIPADPKMSVRSLPTIGDFFVVYRDGYESFSPRAEFLDGYVPI